MLETPESKAPKEVRLDVRMSVQERAQVRANAVQAGLKDSEFVRRAALGVAIKTRLSPDAIRAVIGVGSNLNQLARAANAGSLSDAQQGQLARILEVLSQAVQ